MTAFEDVNSIYSLIIEVVKLRNLIKCPICLDIVNDPVEITCGHVYCSDCIDTFINDASSKLICPMCRKNIKRQRQKPNQNIKQLIKFVTIVTEKLKSQFGCDIVSNIENLRNILNKSENNVLASNSKTEGKGKSKTFVNLTQSNIEDIIPNTSPENKRDVFDLVAELSDNEFTLNRKKTDKTYARKKQVKEKDEMIYQKLTNFEDDAYRLKIIDWLCDSKNKFNRLTQTQSIIDDDSSIASSLDMPSISQTIETASTKPKYVSSSKKRTRSLDVKVKTPKINSRRYSFSDEPQQDVEVINIEEVESDKDVMAKEHVNILQMLEEKCLNTIESELAIQKKEKSSSEKPKKLRKRKRKNNPMNDGAKATTSGWIRAQEINKTFSKTVRGPKKLCVSLSSSSKLGKKPGDKNVGAGKFNNKETTKPVVLLNKLSSELELCKHSPNAEKPKVYCLDKVESYITRNINKVPQSTGKKNADSVPVPKINNNELNSCVNNEISADFKKVDQSDVVFATTESNIQNKPSGASGSIFSQKIKDEDMEDLYSMATQKITHEAEIDNVERNLIALFSSPEKNQNNCGQNDTVVKESTIVNDVDNLLHHLHDTANTLSMLYKNNHNIDDLKLCIGKLKLIFNNFKTTKAPINHLENGMQECINSTTQTVAFDTKSIAIQTDDCDSSGFKISSTADFKTLIQCNAEVQTDFVVEHEPETSKSCGLEKETELTRETRTMTNGDRVYVTSDTNANNITSQGMSLNNNISPKSNKDNYQFTESMDNINFDTQAIFNQNKIKGLDNVNLKDENKIIHETNTQIQLHKQARKKLILCKPDELDSRNCINDNEIEIIEIGETVPLPIDSETTENEMKMKRNKEDLKEKATQRSTISFSLDLDKCNKNAFNSESIRKFKRVRALMEDSDSDDGFVKKNKKKENPYLNPNLSVEFVSQDTQKMNIETKAEQENSVNTMILSQSLNYDEYLEKIMQKYDENNIKTSTPRKELQSHSKQTKSQRIVDKCNVLIKQATASPSFLTHQSKVCDERNITSAEIIKEFDLTFNGTVIDKEAKQSATERKFLTNNKEHLSQLTSCKNVANVGLSQNMPLSNMECLALEFADELKPFSNNHGGTDPQIVILQNIPLHKENTSPRDTKLEYNLEEEWQKMDDADKNSVKSEEVFSDYDTDVVETTPQKHKTALSIGQSRYNRHSVSAIKLPPPGDSPDIFLATDSYLNETFDPPTEFQDCAVIDQHVDEKQDSLEDTDNYDITLVPPSVVNAQKAVDSDKTLTEKEIAQSRQMCDDKEQDEIIICDTDDDVIEIPASSVLQQRDTTNSLNCTRENPNMRDANLIERTLKNNYNPLEIILSKPQRKESSFICTSTPKKQKSILNYVQSHPKISQQTISNFPVEQVRPCIACTRLSKDQVIAICALTNKKLATYSTSFDDTVTHMIVSVKENKCIEHHTMKFVLAVAAGIWVLGFEWIQECLLRNEIVSEEHFEALDVSGKPGPRISRLTRLKNPLLKGFQIHPAAPFVSISKEDIEKVIIMLGGEVVSSLEALDGKSGIRLIIAETKATQDFDIYETWLDMCKVVTVDIEWLSRSVGQYQLLSLRPFTLCSDDYIGELGYPEELLVNTPFSFSQSTYNP